MNRIWMRSPFIRIGLPFIFGIFLTVFFKWHWLFLSILMLIGICFLLFIERRKVWKELSDQWKWGMCLEVVMIITGAWICSITRPFIQPHHYLKTREQDQVYIIQLLDVPVENKSGHKVTGEVLYAGTSEGSLEKRFGKIMVFFRKDSSAASLLADQVITIRGAIELPAKPRHPMGFDYGAYLERNGIHGLIKVDTHQWRHGPDIGTQSVKGTLINYRERLIAQMNGFGIAEAERGVLAALVWGKASEIDAEIMTAYSRAGVVHVLAVSGLHVGLVYALMSPLLKWLIRSRRWAWLKFVLPASVLWIYAGLTGFSPSVLRAAVMFSFFIVAEEFSKTNESFNTLFSSAFLLLVFDPMMLFNIGFQLSYIAVLGIMTLQRPILGLYYSPIKVLNETWKMIAVSIAAQIITIPLTLYYFHQFPTWFLVANILVIPISTVILYAGLFFFSMSWFEPLAWLSINIANSATKLMNAIILMIEKWPRSLIEMIPMSAFQMVLCYGLIFFLFQWWVRSKANVLFGILIVFGCIFCISAMHSVFIEKERMTMLHLIEGKLVVSQVREGKFLAFAET
ncbi:MAG: ComEC/Rec2 family competence protein, partial [Flavobacteriales bacterium]